MLIFLRKVILYIFFICALGYAIIYTAIRLYPARMLGNATEYELWKYKKQAINDHYTQYKNVIIGDSRSMTGLNPTILKHNFINFSLSGTTAFEGYSTLKKFLSKNKIDTLIISYGIFHFIESDVLDKWTLLYQFNTVEDLKYLEKVERKYNITLDNQKPGYSLYFNRWATYFHSPLALRPTFIENLKQNNYKAFIIKNMEENLGFSNVSTADSASGTNTEVEIALKERKFIPNPVIMSYLDSIYAISTKYNIKSALIIPPINYTSYKILRKTTFWHEYNIFLNGLRLKYPKMKIDNKNNYLPNTYFADNNHLNHRGFIFFSNYVKNTLITNIIASKFRVETTIVPPQRSLSPY